MRGTSGNSLRWGHVVHSLTVDTNRRNGALRAGSGSIGSPFLYEAGTGLEVAGFAGRAGSVVDALGAILRTRSGTEDHGIFRCGPTGGVGGRGFSDLNAVRSVAEGSLSALTVRADRFVDAIALRHATATGELIRGRRRGGTGGGLHELQLEPGEFITRVSGRYGTVIDELVIDTNRRADALDAGYNLRNFEPRSPFNASYEYVAPSGAEIIGFFGRSATLIDALGVIYRVR